MSTVGNLGTKYYGVAFPKGSPYLSTVNKLIAGYNEDGRLAKMRGKWFQGEAAKCGGPKSQEEAIEEKRAAPFSKFFDRT